MSSVCTLCKSKNINTIYEVKDMPIFQNKVYDTIEEAKEVTTCNLSISRCNICGFVFNQAFDSKLMEYDENYQNEQNYSEYFKSYLNDIVDIFKNKFSCDLMIVEIGSGKGYFLELLESNGFKNILGFDPAYEGTKKNIIKDYFSTKYDNTNADLIILRHTLEHVENPFSFLQDIANLNSYRGKIFIEVPCFDWIEQKEAFWDIFNEHCNYFTKDSLNIMFNSAESGELFSGQYIYILADLTDLKESVEKTNTIKNEALFHDSLTKYLNFMKDGKSVIWGAGAKGVTFLNILDKDRQLIKYVVDINPKKQNKYIGRTAHKIIDIEYLKKLIKEAEVDSIIIMNENYEQEILEELKEYKVKYITLGETNE